MDGLVVGVLGGTAVGALGRPMERSDGAAWLAYSDGKGGRRLGWHSG